MRDVNNKKVKTKPEFVDKVCAIIDRALNDENTLKKFLLKTGAIFEMYILNYLTFGLMKMS
jgi:hypothetical protein